MKFLDTKVIYSIPRQPIDYKICLKSIKVLETSGGLEIHFERLEKGGGQLPGNLKNQFHGGGGGGWRL